MKIPLKKAYFVWWATMPDDGTEECLWGTLDEMWSYLGMFALARDVFGVFTTAKEAQAEHARQLRKGRPRG